MKICKTCGKHFSPSKYRPDQIYCSKGCKPHTVYRHICSVCNRHFESGNKYQENCSHACANTLKKNPDKKSVFTCEWCKKQFTEWAYRKPSFCSNQCRSKFAAIQSRPSAQRPETMKVKKYCAFCGKEYTTTIFQIILRNGKYCSKECKYKASSIQKRGSGNVNYKGGHSVSRGPNWSQQSKLARKRDDYTCQICGLRYTFNGRNKTDVHHIIPYRLFNGDYIKANDLSNLIVLCRTHHRQVECGKIKCPTPKA